MEIFVIFFEKIWILKVISLSQNKYLGSCIRRKEKTFITEEEKNFFDCHPDIRHALLNNKFIIQGAYITTLLAQLNTIQLSYVKSLKDYSALLHQTRGLFRAVG